jgi:hypothetical protein
VIYTQCSSADAEKDHFLDKKKVFFFFMLEFHAAVMGE